MCDNQASDFINGNDGNDMIQGDELWCEIEGELYLLVDESITDLNGINPDCNESQQFRGDEFNVDEFGDLPL